MNNGHPDYHGASVGEQDAAGVSADDSVYTARNKVEDYRRAFGLDPITGGIRQGPTGQAQRPPAPASDGESLWLQILAAVFQKLILWPAAIALVLGVLFLAVAIPGLRFDGPTLAARAAAGEFAGYQPAPLRRYFSDKELAIPVNAERLLAEIKTDKMRKPADASKPADRALAGKAYRCMLQPGCRVAISSLDSLAGDNLPQLASRYLGDLVSRGSEDASRDMCLFAVSSGTSYRDLIRAHDFCRQAVQLNRKSKAAATALAELEDSWALQRARAYDYLHRLKQRWPA